MEVVAAAGHKGYGEFFDIDCPASWPHVANGLEQTFALVALVIGGGPDSGAAKRLQFMRRVKRWN